jgi:hypothetical protein
MGYNNASLKHQDLSGNASNLDHEEVMAVNAPEFKIKVKTEICRKWLEHNCRYTDANCAFAHGEDQIQKKQHCTARYKLSKCNGYHDELVCMYGTRCQFAHLTLDHCSDYRQALSENVRQISIRISGVADP